MGVGGKGLCMRSGSLPSQLISDFGRALPRRRGCASGDPPRLHKIEPHRAAWAQNTPLTAAYRDKRVVRVTDLLWFYPIKTDTSSPCGRGQGDDVRASHAYSLVKES